MLAFVVGALITGFLLVCALAPDPDATRILGHLAIVGLLAYLLARELTRTDSAEQRVDRPQHRSP